MEIKKLKGDAMEKTAAQMALRQGRCRIKNAKRLEKKNSEENPQAGDASSSSKEMSDLKTQMAKMQQQLEAAQAKRSVSVSNQ